ncbi:AraC family transcriptional regulator [Mucilaginibacter sp. UYCu711]|uniref:AraC family transcriptional regulator n=1 Tax=Mucilaginibacter sp. UYCu711 TaxID=3156339 RepID=UPI003D23FEC0
MAGDLGRVPFQKMLNDFPVQVVKLSELPSSSSYQTHRHSFYMLFWTIKGKGYHRINYCNYDLLPGTVFFMHEGHVHQMLKYPEDGYIILFKQTLLDDYLRSNPLDEQNGLFDYFNRQPFVILNESVTAVFQVLIPLTAKDALNEPFGRSLNIELSLLLFQTNRLFTNPNPIQDNPQVDLIRKLRVLINANFHTERDAPFYGRALGLPARKLNEITRKHFGKMVKRLVADRLLTECEALLGGTNMLIKEIIIELNFADNAHFSYFFRKEKKMTPSMFRKRMHDLQQNRTD